MATLTQGDDIFDVTVGQYDVTQHDNIVYYDTQNVTSEELCYSSYMGDSHGSTLVECETIWDGFKCWPHTPANRTASQSCRGIPNEYSIYFSHEARAYRVCTSDGTWQDNYTDYTQCVRHVIDNATASQSYYNSTPPPFHWFNRTHPDMHEGDSTRVLLAGIYVAGSLLSLVFLGITFFIFAYFRSLVCGRISIHKNLVFSFILRSVLTLVIFSPDLVPELSYRHVEWLCKSVTVLMLYSVTCNIAWMLVEGMYLHNRIAITVFHTEAPFKLFYFLGWVLPALLLFTWSGCQGYVNPRPCWANWYPTPCTWGLLLPILAALLLNSVFLINIVRILITRLRANNTLEVQRIRKAVKATAVLFPLLGLTSLLYAAQPSQPHAATAYRVVNAIVQCSQGMLVAIIYCFMNSEVQMVVRKKWWRYRSERTGRSLQQSCRSSSLLHSSRQSMNGSAHHGTRYSRSAHDRSQRYHMSTSSVDNSHRLHLQSTTV